MALKLAGLIISLSTIIMTFGYIGVIVTAARSKETRNTLLCIFVPFFCFYYILKMPENKTKQFLTISTMGAFTFYILAAVFKIIMTPPV